VSIEISRRNFLKAAGGLGAKSLFGIGAVEEAEAATSSSVRFANWPLYLDYDVKGRIFPTLQNFTRQTHIPVKYLEVIDDNDTFTAKITPQFRLKRDIGYDIVVLTEWMATRWIGGGFVAKFDDLKIPNKKNILPYFVNGPLDPGRHYSLPWAGVIAGFAWNKKLKPKGIHTMEQLFAPANKGRVEILSEMTDTIGLIMMWQGVDITKPFHQDKFMNAIDFMKKMIYDGFIRSVKGQSYQEDLINGDAVAVMGWSGDINQLNSQKSNQFGFAIPESGGIFSTDVMMIPALSPHKISAEALVNYYYNPIVAAHLANYINYVCPVAGAQQAMEKINPKQLQNKLIFPDANMWKMLHVFRDLSQVEQISFASAFQKASGITKRVVR